MSTVTDHIEYDGPRFAMIPEWLLFDPTISMSAKAVYGVLVRHGSNPSNCFPSTARIAALLGTTNKTVRKLIDELVERGVVERHARYNKDGGFTSNGYVVRGRETPPERLPVEPEQDQPLVGDSEPPLVPTEPGPWVVRDHALVPAEPLKENHLTRANLTRKQTRVVSSENSQPALIEMDGLTPAASVPDRFQEFYDAYGRKVGRADAINEWKRAIKKVPAETIIQAAIAWRAAFDASGSDPCYVPHPSRWLKREQWADELPKPKTGARKTTRAPIVERTGETMNMKMVGGKLVPA